MVARETMISVAGQHVLLDMIELQMYLVTQTQEKPWSILPRGVRKSNGRDPYSHSVEASVGAELFRHGLIEATSNRTYVVSKAGHRLYAELKP